MDSLTYDSEIVGPHTGAFKDLSRIDLVHTFKDYPDLISLIDRIMATSNKDGARREKIKHFVQENSWEAFSDRIFDLLN